MGFEPTIYTVHAFVCTHSYQRSHNSLHRRMAVEKVGRSEVRLLFSAHTAYMMYMYIHVVGIHVL